MPRQVKELTDLSIRAFITEARAGTLTHKDGPKKGEPLKAPKLFDGDGLFLMLTAAGTPVWRVKYLFDKTDKTISPGAYPEITLQLAREKREWVRAKIKDGRDPIQVERVERAANVTASATTFEGVCERWLALRKEGWSKSHYRTSTQALKRDILSAIGDLPIGEIDTPMLANVISKVNARSESTAKKLCWSLVGIFDLEKVQKGSKVRENPARALYAVLTDTTEKKPRPALLEFPELGELLRRIDQAAITPAARMAHRLVAFTFVRSKNLVEAHWKEFDLDGEIPSWTIPRDQMKVRKGRKHNHRILLSPTITAELRRWKSVTGGQDYLFASRSTNRTKESHLSAEALEHFFSRTLAEDLRGKHSIHGWRSSFSTLTKDADRDKDAVNLTLDHLHDNEVARAYDRGKRLDQRLAVMHWWDSQLTAAQDGADVTPISSAQPKRA